MEPGSTLVTIFGGSGFVGTQIVQLMARRGYRIRVATRRPDLAGHVKPLGSVGQVMPIQANVRDVASVERAVRGVEVVINLVGIGYEAGRQRFEAVHVEGAANVARAARAEGVLHLVHMSALGADPESPSAYARTKAGGEAEVLKAYPQAVIMRPSIQFGPGDGFFNLMGSLVRALPIVPLIGAKTRFQPVFVGDVAQAFVIAAEGGARTGKTYELGGPEIATYRALMQRVLQETGRKNPLVPAPRGLGRVMALPFALLPFPPLVTTDQVELLQVDNVVSDVATREKRTVKGLGIQPTAMEAVLPSYLWRFRRHGQFDRRQPIQQRG